MIDDLPMEPFEDEDLSYRPETLDPYVDDFSPAPVIPNVTPYDVALFGDDGTGETNGLLYEVYGGDAGGDIDYGPPYTEGLLWATYGADGTGTDDGLLWAVYGADGSGTTDGLLFEVYGADGTGTTEGLDYEVYSTDSGALQARVTALEAAVGTYTQITAVGADSHLYTFYVLNTTDYPLVDTTDWWDEVTIDINERIMQVEA